MRFTNPYPNVPHVTELFIDPKDISRITVHDDGTVWVGTKSGAAFQVSANDENLATLKNLWKVTGP